MTEKRIVELTQEQVDSLIDLNKEMDAMADIIEISMLRAAEKLHQMRKDFWKRIYQIAETTPYESEITFSSASKTLTIEPAGTHENEPDAGRHQARPNRSEIMEKVKNSLAETFGIDADEIDLRQLSKEEVLSALADKDKDTGIAMVIDKA